MNASTMNLMVNGKSHEHQGRGTIESLLKELGADRERVAIMINDNIINCNERDSITLKNGDRIEVLTFAGGG